MFSMLLPALDDKLGMLLPQRAESAGRQQRFRAREGRLDGGYGPVDTGGLASDDGPAVAAGYDLVLGDVWSLR